MLTSRKNHLVFPNESLTAYDRYGASLLASDFNKDGYADLAAGSPGNNIDGITQAGTVNIIYGSAGGLNSTASLTSRQTWSQNSTNILDQAETYDGFGTALAAGDFNKDGYQDLVVGVPSESIGTLTSAGGINVLYGSTTGLTANNNQFWSQDSSGILDQAESTLVITPGDDVSYYAGDQFGSSVATGDFNKDGYVDVIVGAPREGIGTIQAAGAVNVLYGSKTGLTATGNQFWSQDSLLVQDVAEAYDLFGASLTTGDFNKDGYVDAVIGVPNEDIGTIANAGAVNVLYGSKTGLTATGNQFWSQDSTGIQETAEAYDDFGKTLASGDFNKDGYADLVIGTPDEDLRSSLLLFPPSNVVDVGTVQVLYGSASGLTATNNQLWTPASFLPLGFLTTSESYSRFGSSLSSGDFNKDGYQDLAVGAAGKKIGTANDAGGTYILYGSATGLTKTGNQFWSQDSTGVVDSAEAYDGFGSSLAAGDFDGDSYADLSVGVPSEDTSGLIFNPVNVQNVSLATQVPSAVTSGLVFSTPTNASAKLSGGLLGNVNSNLYWSPQTDAGGVNVIYGSKHLTFDVNFKAQNQSIWNTGGEFIYKDNRFLGPQWGPKNYEWTFDPPFYDEVGVYASTSGKIGLQSNLEVKGGVVNAALPIDLWFDTPGKVKPGQTVTISSGYTLDKAATFSTIGPTASYALDFIFNLFAEAGAVWDGDKKKIVGINKNYTKNLLNINPNNSSFSLSESQLDGFGSFDLKVPKVNTQDNALDGTLSAQGSDTFLNASLDLDRVAVALFNAFGIPLPSLSGEKTLDLGIADFKLNYDLLDIDLISKLLLRQKFDLAVDNLTGQLVLENGQAINFTAGQDITFVVPQGIGNSLDFKVSLNLGAKLTNQTTIGYDVDAELEALQATLKYDLPWPLPDGSKSIGPLVDQHYDILSGDVSLYNKTFALGGLNTQAVSFEIAA